MYLYWKGSAHRTVIVEVRVWSWLQIFKGQVEHQTERQLGPQFQP